MWLKAADWAGVRDWRASESYSTFYTYINTRDLHDVIKHSIIL
jgi:hypothetical protein